MKALLFPGQGSQAVGMGAGLFERFPNITECADGILGYSIAELCLKDRQGKLSHTRYAQPAIYVVNALHLAAQEEEGLGGVAFAAGHSLGEYSALLAAGVLGFESGLELVKKRGELFEEAGEGGMVAVLGLPVQTVRVLLDENDGGGVDIANLNSERQVVISGPRAEFARLRPVFEKAGCELYQELNVSGPFHSRYMRSAKEAFEAFLGRFSFADPSFPVLSNVTARPYATGRAADFLVEQIDHPVRWNETIRYMLRNGVTELAEVGHGRVLTKLCNAIRRAAKAEPGAADGRRSAIRRS